MPTDSAPIVKLLLAQGASLEARTRVGAKPAVRPPGAGGGSHGVGIVRSGVPPQGEQLPTPGGMTPLLYAARDGSLDAARVLIEAGASLNAADPNDMTPLMMAITNGKIPVAQLLVDNGADVRAADWYGRTPLWAAVEIRNLDMRSGATENGIDRDAAMRLIASIIDKGADVNARVKEFPPQRRHLLPRGLFPHHHRLHDFEQFAPGAPLQLFRANRRGLLHLGKSRRQHLGRRCPLRERLSDLDHFHNLPQ